MTQVLAAARVIRYRNPFLLALASPIIAELLSGSAPPLAFFIPWIFGLFVLFYGCNAILIRELTLRWGTGWRGVLLLGAAFGVLQEGLATRAFFDPNWPSLGPMVNHGRWLGVNWIWTADAIVYHAVFSSALPILLVYQISPNGRRVAWLNARELASVAVLFAFASAVFLHSGKTRYPAPASYLWGCVVAIVLFSIGARYVPAAQDGAKRMDVRPLRFAILGFAGTFLLVLQIYLVPQLLHSPLMTAAVFAALVLGVAGLLTAWAGPGGPWPREECALLSGALGCFAAMGFFQEVNPRSYSMRGISLVSSCALAGLFWLWRRGPAAAERS